MKQNTEKNIPLTRIQKIIAKRMMLSKQTIPCFYLESKADVTELMASRPKLRKSLGIKVTTNAFYIRAIAIAAGQFPLIAAKLEDDAFQIPPHINVGFAVSAPQGLVVPVIKNADKKTLADISADEKILTNKARSNQLTPLDMDDETMALSNLGIYGIDSFFGIVPPQTSTILAVGGITETLCPRQGDKHVVRKILNLSLAVDHKVLNGDYASKFLKCIKELLESPDQLI